MSPTSSPSTSQSPPSSTLSSPQLPSLPNTLIPTSFALHASVSSSVFKTWTPARQRAWDRRFTSPSRYFYSFHHPSYDVILKNKKQTASFSLTEHRHFLSALRRLPPPCDWGTFSLLLPGRVGVDCRRHFQLCRDAGFVTHKGIVKRRLVARASIVMKKRKHTGSDDSRLMVGKAVFLRRLLKKFVPGLDNSALVSNIDDFWLKDMERVGRVDSNIEIANWMEKRIEKQQNNEYCRQVLCKLRVCRSLNKNKNKNKRNTKKVDKNKKQEYEKVSSELNARKDQIVKKNKGFIIRRGDYDHGEESSYTTSREGGTSSSTAGSICTIIGMDMSDISPVNKKNRGIGAAKRVKAWQADSTEAMVGRKERRRQQEQIGKELVVNFRGEGSECTADDVGRYQQHDDDGEDNHFGRVSLDFVVNHTEGDNDFDADSKEEEEEDDDDDNDDDVVVDDDTMQTPIAAESPSTMEKEVENQNLRRREEENENEVMAVGLSCGHRLKCTRELLRIFSEDVEQMNNHYSRIQWVERRALLRRFEDFVDKMVTDMKSNNDIDDMRRRSRSERIEGECAWRMRSFMDEMNDMRSRQLVQQDVLDMVSDIMVC